MSKIDRNMQLNKVRKNIKDAAYKEREENYLKYLIMK